MVDTAPTLRSELLDAVRRLAPDITAAAPGGEHARRMSPELARRLSEAGLFRMSVPPEYRGWRTELSTQLEVIEAVARADGSAGWCVMIASATSVLAGHLEDEVLQEVFGDDPLASACGVYAPKGQARRVEGGYRVSGRWAFASGCEHSAWRVGGAMVADGEEPQMRLMIFRAEDTRVIDTWHVAGLRGTGSHDIEVHDVFVPEGRAIDPRLGTPRHAGLLYRMPLFGFLAAEIAAVALGIARGSLDAFLELATVKVPMGARRTLAKRGTVHAMVAKAEASYRAGRAFLRETVRGCEQQLRTGSELGLTERIALRMAANHAVRASVQAVDAVYRAGGGTTLYRSAPLQRSFQDIHATTQHAMVSLAIDELCGRALLGEPVPDDRL